MLWPEELMMDVGQPKHVFHITKTCCRLSKLPDFVAASKKFPCTIFAAKPGTSPAWVACGRSQKFLRFFGCM